MVSHWQKTKLKRQTGDRKNSILQRFSIIDETIVEKEQPPKKPKPVNPKKSKRG
jgi:hypothetical protein